MGADITGRKDLVDLWEGHRESAPSWTERLLESRAPGRRGDAAAALLEAEDAQVLDKLPKGMQKQAKQRLPAIWMAPGPHRGGNRR